MARPLAFTRLVVSSSILVSFAGCSSSAPEPNPGDSPPPSEGAEASPDASPGTAAPAAGDAPEISRSVGEEGGVILFWPRVIPRDVVPDTRALAGDLQAHLREVIARALPGRPIDVRPEPERVCPRAGCTAMTAGILLTKRENGCAALALISPSGTSAATIVPWGGGVRLQWDSVPFRDPPETRVTVTDYVNCDGFADKLGEGEPAVVAALRAAASE